jgi:hypothetical protein
MKKIAKQACSRVSGGFATKVPKKRPNSFLSCSFSSCYGEKISGLRSAGWKIQEMCGFAICRLILKADLRFSE